jgi:hypothetical protein
MTDASVAHQPTILVVEDDDRIRTSLSMLLESEGFSVRAFATGEDAIASFEPTGDDLALIDVMLPGIDGFECCRHLRLRSDVPVIMVTARDDSHDVVTGLEAGADDYVTKPYVPTVLVARIRALLRRTRTESETSSVVRLGAFEFHPINGTVTRPDGVDIRCTRTEFKLLLELAEHADEVISREDLLERVWGYDYFGDSRLVDVHIGRLRTKVEVDPSAPRYLLTIRGRGYQFSV